MIKNVLNKLLLALILFICWQTANAEFVGIYKTTDTIQFAVNLGMDSAGIYGTPDSIQVFTRLNNAVTATYKATGAGYACTGVDTGKEYGGTQIWYQSAIADIDGAGGTTYGLAIDVYTWYKKLPVQTHASALVISNSLDAMLDASMDSSSMAATRILVLRDSVTIVHTQLNAVRDSVNALHVLTIALRDSVYTLHVLNLALRDSASILHATILANPLAVWNIAFNTAFTAGSMGDSSNNFVSLSSWASLVCDSIFLSRGSATGSQILLLQDSLTKAKKSIDSIHAKIDSSKAIIYATWDSLLSGAFSGSGGGGIDSATAEFIVAKVSQDSSFAKIGANRKWHLSNLILLDAFKDDTGGLFVHSDSDVAGYFYSLDNWGIRISNSDGDPLVGSILLGGNMKFGNGTNQGIIGFITIDSSAIKLRDSVAILHTDLLKVRDTLQKVRDSVNAYDNWLRDSLHVVHVAALLGIDSTHTSIVDILRAIDSLHLIHAQTIATTDTTHVIHVAALLGIDSTHAVHTRLVATQAQIDSLLKWSGYGYRVWSMTKYANNADSIIFMHTTDTLGCEIFYHSGGDPGDQPDSTKWFPVDSLR